MLRAATGALLAAAALAASGCGGGNGDGSGVAADDYATTVCSALTDWQTELQSSVQSMGSASSASSTPAEVRTRLVEFMEAMSTSTDTLVAEIKAAGAPDVEDGEALHRDLVAGLEDVQRAFADALDNAKELPTSDPAAFQAQAVQLSATLTQQGSAIGTTFSSLGTKYDSQELNEAFNDAAACQNLS